MVKVREDHPITYDGAIDLDAWLSRLKLKREAQQMQMLRRAAELVFGHHEALTSTGASCCAQGLEMAEILAGLGLDTDTLVAAVLYNTVESGSILLEVVEKELGPGIAKLVQGVSEMEAHTIAVDDPFVSSGAETFEIRKLEVSCRENNHMGMG